MNFAKIIKEEILSKPPKDRESKRTMLMGILRGSGSIFYESNELGLLFTLTDENVASMVSNYLQSLYDYEIREISVSEDHLNKKDKFELSITGDKAFLILKDLNILVEDNNETVVNLKFLSNINNENELKSFIRGLFLTSGNCVIPSENNSNKTHYHLELVFSHGAPCSELNGRLAKFGVSTKIIRRKESYVLYIKSGEEIKNFIAFINCPLAVLKLTDYMINRDMSNYSNRQKNCDLGNVNRLVEASIKQQNAIKIIERNFGLNTLKDELRITAIARKNNPDISLNELAEKLGITKSCLNHRLRKIIEISEKI